MNFLFDLTSLQPLKGAGKVHGGGKYALKVLFALLSGERTGIEFYASYRSSKKLPDSVAELLVHRKVKLLDLDGADLSSLVKKHQIHKYYSPLPYDVLGISTLPCKVYGTMHGLRQLETEMELHALNYFTTFKGKVKVVAKWLLSSYVLSRKYKQYESILKAIDVITVSEHSKFSIKSYYPQVDVNVSVFYSPDVTEFGDSASAQFHLPDNSFFLLVSGDVWYKNNLRAAIALDEIFSAYPTCEKKVVITGATNKDVYLSKLKNPDRFVFLDYVEEGFLIELYRKAFAFIYMSLNEGFGYPPLEAMKQGVPVVASPFTSITEVCADAVLYANPYSTFEIKNRILQFLDAECYERYKERGIQQYAVIRAKQELDLELLVSYLLA